MEIPKQIQTAKQNLEEAQEEFSTALKEFAPDLPYEVGEEVYYEKYTFMRNDSDELNSGVVHRINYDPYNPNNIDGWVITVLPMTKDFSRKQKRRNSETLRDSSIIVKRSEHELREEKGSNNRVA